MRLKAVEEVDEIKRGFLALISHETRTPLTVIRGMTELLLDDRGALSAEDSRQMLRRMLYSAMRLSRLSEKTLLACQLGSVRDGAIVRGRKFSIHDLLSEVDEETSDLAAECGVTMNVEVEPATFEGNLNHLVKAVSYVIENAVRFSPTEGTVYVRGLRVEDVYELSVTDSGPGIAPDKIEGIFDLFAIDDIDHHSAGLGISLALARRIAEMHRGSLTVRSGKESGSTFTFRLPAER